MFFLFFVPFFLASATSLDRKSVNLALETSVLLDPQQKHDLHFVKSLRKFLGKLEDVLQPKSFRANEEKKLTVFTDFLENLKSAIQELKDDDLKKIALIFESELNSVIHKESFKKLIVDRGIKKFLRKKAKRWSEMNADKLRDRLKKLDHETLVKSFDNLNKYFSEQDEKQLEEYVEHVNKINNETNYFKLVKKALKFIVIDRYNKLNESQKTELDQQFKYIIDRLREKNMIESPVKDKTKVSTEATTQQKPRPALIPTTKAKTIIDSMENVRNRNMVTSISFYRKTFDKVKNETAFSGSEREDILVDRDDSLEQLEIGLPISNTTEKLKDPVILEKNIEIFVERDNNSVLWDNKLHSGETVKPIVEIVKIPNVTLTTVPDTLNATMVFF